MRCGNFDVLYHSHPAIASAYRTIANSLSISFLKNRKEQEIVQKPSKKGSFSVQPI
jgi:hypothetical protein